MITVPTTLVLGAGASKPYGFPTGIELRQIILRNLMSKKPEWINHLRAQNVDETVALRFAYQFRNSATLSIDSFLASHQDLTAVGKICIALALVPFEQEHKLYSPPLSGQVGWYEYLWRNIATPHDITPPGIITIVTFNYDRSLDQFIYNAIKSRNSDQLEKGEFTIERLLDLIKIVHIHGQLGYLPWQESRSRPYSPDLKESSLEIAWRQIRVPSEHYTNRMTDTIVNHRLSQSERIYFLGFGYDEDNLQKLNIGNIKNKRMIGTSYGLTKMERGEIDSKWHIELPDANCEISGFLRNHAPLN